MTDKMSHTVNKLVIVLEVLPAPHPFRIPTHHHFTGVSVRKYS